MTATAPLDAAIECPACRRGLPCKDNELIVARKRLERAEAALLRIRDTACDPAEVAAGYFAKEERP